MIAATSRIVVVGASIGGLTTAESLRSEGFDGELVLIGDEAHLPYHRPPLSKQVLMGEWEPERAAIRTASELDDLGIEVRTDTRAVGLDVAARSLQTSRGPVDFDQLVIATGTEPRRHPALPAAHVLRTVTDALELRDALDRASSVAVIGSGVLGSEIASAARKHGTETLLTGITGALSMGSVKELLSDRLAALHEANGVQLLLAADLEHVEESGGTTALTFRSGEVRRVDLVVTVIGGMPRTDWLRSSTLTLGDGIVCDSVGEAAAGIHAVGDVAAWADPVSGRPVRVEHQTNAIEQGLAVAQRIVHGTAPSPPVPFFWSEVHGTRITAVGWFDAERPLVEQSPHEGPGAVLISLDAGDRPRGAVGWGASPRAFRAARLAVTASALSPAASQGVAR